MDSRNIDIKSVILGSTIDVGVTFVTYFIFEIVYIVYHVSPGLTPGEVAALMQGSTSYMRVLLIVVLGITLISGYLTTLISKSAALENPLTMGAVCAVLGFLLVFGFERNAPIWYYVLSFAFAIPCAALGGVLRRVQIQRRST